VLWLALTLILLLLSTGSYFSFASVNRTGGFAWNRLDKYPLEAMQISNYFDVDVANNETGQTIFSLNVPTDNTFNVYGFMDSTHSYLIDGINIDTEIEWNLQINRIYGWYGDGGIWEKIDDTFGE
jgi:hypothetical protein